MKRAVVGAAHPGLLARMAVQANLRCGFTTTSKVIPPGARRTGTGARSDTVILPVSGAATLSSAGDLATIEAGDLVVVEAGVPFRVENDGALPFSYLEAVPAVHCVRGAPR